MAASKEQKHHMKVVGLGLCRTGTFSLSRALDILHLGPAYHYLEHTPTVREMRLWSKVAQVDPREAAPYLDEIFQNRWPSAVDVPTSCFPEAFYYSYPDAKFVVTHRDYEKWLPSWKTCIHEFYRAYPCRWYSYRNYVNFTTTKRLVYDGQYGGEPVKNARRVYDSHMEICKRVIPADKLLIHRSEDGWKPLCDFLGVPIPNVPYPHANNAKALEAHVSEDFIHPSRIMFSVLFVLALAYFFALYHLFYS